MNYMWKLSKIKDWLHCCTAAACSVLPLEARWDQNNSLWLKEQFYILFIITCVTEMFKSCLKAIQRHTIQYVWPSWIRTPFPHFITSHPPSLFSSFLSFSLPSCPIIITTDCVTQTFCHRTEACQWQITLINNNVLSIHYELPPSCSHLSIMLWQLIRAGKWGEGVRCSRNPAPYGFFGHYTSAYYTFSF